MTTAPTPIFRHADADIPALTADVVAVAVAKGDDGVEVGDAAAEVGTAIGMDIATACAAVDMDGSVGTTALLPAGDGIRVSLVVVCGLGEADEVDADALRAASAAATGIAVRKETLATLVHADTDVDDRTAARAIVEGTRLAHHSLRTFKTDDEVRALAEVVIIGGDADQVAAGIEHGTTSAAATLLARDLGNTPSADKRPPMYADRVVELFAELPVKVEVWDQSKLEAEGFGGHLSVAAGSEVGPRFVQLRYRPDGATRHLGLLGKGITFDSGGLSLKPAKGMEWMKIDMAGSATVAATMWAAATAGLAVNLTGFLCMAENMPSGSATRPGDVITMHGGITVEVLNTDAEGRLVMADGLAYSHNYDLDALVDVATLTGAALHAVGPKYTAIMANDDELADALLAAAEQAAEPMARLPLAVREYDEDLKSDIADIRNVGGNAAGTIRAALFLNRFVPEGTKWAHLDVAGSAWNDAATYGSYVPRGATGMPVRTLFDWVAAQAG